MARREISPNAAVLDHDFVAAFDVVDRKAALAKNLLRRFSTSIKQPAVQSWSLLPRAASRAACRRAYS